MPDGGKTLYLAWLTLLYALKTGKRIKIVGPEYESKKATFKRRDDA
jgi:hypothetical protein